MCSIGQFRSRLTLTLCPQNIHTILFCLFCYINSYWCSLVMHLLIFPGLLAQRRVGGEGLTWILDRDAQHRLLTQNATKGKKGSKLNILQNFDKKIGPEIWHFPHFCSNIGVKIMQIFQRPEKGGRNGGSYVVTFIEWVPSPGLLASVSEPILKPPQYSNTSVQSNHEICMDKPTTCSRMLY